MFEQASGVSQPSSQTRAIVVKPYYGSKNSTIPPQRHATHLMPKDKQFLPSETSDSQISLIATATPSAPTTDTLHPFPFLQLCLRHSTDAGGVKVGFLGLDAAETAQLLVPLLLPLRDQVGVGVVVLE